MWLDEILNCISKQGRPPRGHDAFPPVSDFPSVFEKFSDSMEKFQNFTFFRKISRFSSAKISVELFLAIDHKCQISPYFPCFTAFPPFRENYYFPPTLKNSPLF